MGQETNNSSPAMVQEFWKAERPVEKGRIRAIRLALGSCGRDGGKRKRQGHQRLLAYDLLSMLPTEPPTRLRLARALYALLRDGLTPAVLDRRCAFKWGSRVRWRRFPPSQEPWEGLAVCSFARTVTLRSLRERRVPPVVNL